MSSIDLTVTSGIVHLRRREKTFAEVQLGRPPKLIGGRQRALLGCVHRTAQPASRGKSGSIAKGGNDANGIQAEERLQQDMVPVGGDRVHQARRRAAVAVLEGG